MKMRNGVPKKAGATSGMMLLVAPRPFHIKNSGIIVTCGGSIIVAMTITSRAADRATRSSTVSRPRAARR